MTKSTQIWIRGELLVANKFTELWYIVSTTYKNTESIDLLVASPKTWKACSIQVKSSEWNNYWMLSKKSEYDKDKSWLFYVFISLSYPKFYIVHSNEVANTVYKEHRNWLKSLGKNWRKHVDTNMRKFFIKKEHENNFKIIEDYLN